MDFTNTEVEGFRAAFRGMRNPKNSWHLSDSHVNGFNGKFIIGKKDMELAQTLITAGTEHCKFLRQIQVWVDVDMPRYWWSEEDTYHFNTKNSCSTMHKLLNNKNEITRSMFVFCEEDIDIIDLIIKRLNELRVEFLTTKNDHLMIRAKRILAEGFLQMRTLNTNYGEIRGEYHQRKHHRLVEEWQDTFCVWVESLPYAKELILFTGKENN